MSETTGTERIGESDQRDAERGDPSVAGKPEIPAGESPPATEEDRAGRLEEREQRQHGVQQHGDTFAVESDQPTDTSGVPINRRNSEGVEGKGNVMGEQQQQRPQQTADEDHTLEDPQDESLLDKGKDKVADLVDAPEGAEYDEGKTNPVTGQRRD